MPEEVIRLEQFSTDELRALSGIALLLNRFNADRQDRMIAYLSQGGPLVPIGAPELTPLVVDQEEMPVV